jgi:hypothetical protein
MVAMNVGSDERREKWQELDALNAKLLELAKQLEIDRSDLTTLVREINASSFGSSAWYADHFLAQTKLAHDGGDDPSLPIAAAKYLSGDVMRCVRSIAAQEARLSQHAIEFNAVQERFVEVRAWLVDHASLPEESYTEWLPVLPDAQD